MVQYRQFGQVAMELGLIEAADLFEALEEQAQRRQDGEKVLLGQVLLERGILNEEGIKRILDTLYPVVE